MVAEAVTRASLPIEVQDAIVDEVDVALISAHAESSEGLEAERLLGVWRELQVFPPDLPLSRKLLLEVVRLVFTKIVWLRKYLVMAREYKYSVSSVEDAIQKDLRLSRFCAWALKEAQEVAMSTTVRVRVDLEEHTVLCPKCGWPLRAEVEEVYGWAEVFYHPALLPPVYTYTGSGRPVLRSSKVLYYESECGLDLPGDTRFEIVDDPALPSWRDGHSKLTTEVLLYDRKASPADQQGPSSDWIQGVFVWSGI